MVRVWLVLTSLLAGMSAARAGGDLGALAHRLAELVNAERAKEGLKPLAWDDRLAAVALAHCQDMRAEALLSQG